MEKLKICEKIKKSRGSSQKNLSIDQLQLNKDTEILKSQENNKKYDKFCLKKKNFFHSKLIQNINTTEKFEKAYKEYENRIKGSHFLFKVPKGVQVVFKDYNDYYSTKFKNSGVRLF